MGAIREWHELADGGGTFLSPDAAGRPEKSAGSPAPAPVFRLREVRKSYDGKEVLRVDSLDIRRGLVTGVMGPSGAGKTTLLRLLNMLERPSAGFIHFDGISINGSPALLGARRRIGMVFQRPVLFRGSVLDNVAYGLRVRGERRDVPGRAMRALELVGLRDLAHRRAATLSGGEAQRVALARAIVLEPEVLLLDEATANLDPAHVAMIEDLVRETNRRHGTTVVMVTHNVFQARRLAHHVVFLLGGRLVEEGPAAGVFARPADERRRAFIAGRMVY